LLAAVTAAALFGLAADRSVLTSPEGHAAIGRTPVQLTLPDPTGPHRIGTISLHLIDTTRDEPWATGRPARELMVQLWFPAEPATGQPRAPWVSPVQAQTVLTLNPAGTVRLPTTHAYAAAPVQPGTGPRPVVLYSHGDGLDRGCNTALVEGLASHGYIVLTIDHTYDASIVEFPDGRLAGRRSDLIPVTDERAMAVRQADAQFALDQLAALNGGHNIDAAQRPLPPGLRGAFDLSRVGMFGHSYGCATTAAAMHADPRIKAGVNLDGALYGPVTTAGLDQPYLLINAEGRDPELWAWLWPRLRGWHLELHVAGTAHLSFTDLQVLQRQAPGLLPALLPERIGTIDGPRSVLLQRTYIRAFFDLHLLGVPNQLFTGASPTWPEVHLTQ
jgi:predicted dienelactone hydrolase